MFNFKNKKKNKKEKPILTQEIKSKNIKTMIIANLIVYAICVFSAPLIFKILAPLFLLLLFLWLRKPVRTENDEEINNN